MAFLLWIAAVIIAIAGIAKILSGDILVGLFLIVLACVIGPGGWSVYR